MCVSVCVRVCGEVVGGGDQLWALMVGGSPVGNEPLTSCNIVDMSKLVRTNICMYIYVYIYIYIIKTYTKILKRR